MNLVESAECPCISIEKQKFAPYKCFEINLSSPIRHQNNNTSQYNPFNDIYKQLGIKRPGISNLINNKCLKIGSKNEENEIQKFYQRRKKYVGSRFLDSLQDKDYYPIARKSVILHESHKIKHEKKAGLISKKVSQGHKVVFIGNSSVGKTSIISQIIYNRSNVSQEPTVGVDFFSKNITVGTDTVGVQILDTADQEQFHSLILPYLRNSTIAIIVYDISNQESFKSLERWIKNVQDVANPALIIVGNKTDLEKVRAVSTEDGEEFAQSQNAKFIETSSRNSSNIDKLEGIIGQILISKRESKFNFLYENFHQNQSTLQQLLTIFPNRPNDFATQFGLKLRTDSQDKFLERLYMLNFDVLISSYYLLRTIDNIPPPKDLQIDIMKCRSKPLLPPSNPLQSCLPENSIGQLTSDYENVIDILDFNVALESMRITKKQVKRFTKPISSRNSQKVLMSSTPSAQGFISIYEKDRAPSDSILRADIFSLIGIRIRRNQRQEHIELTKNEIGWSQERIPTRRVLLTSQEMFFERRKAVALAHSRSGSNSSLSSVKSFSSQLSQVSTMSQSSTTQQPNSAVGSSANNSPMWNREETSNPFTSQLFKDQIVRAESKTMIIENVEAIEGPNGLIENDNDSESDSSFY